MYRKFYQPQRNSNHWKLFKFMPLRTNYRSKVRLKVQEELQTRTNIERIECWNMLTAFDVSRPSSVHEYPKTWSWWLLQIGTPLVVLVGLTGNVLSLLVLKSRRFRAKSYSHYLCALAVFDSLVLIGKYLRRVNGLLTSGGHAGLFQSYGDAGCKVSASLKQIATNAIFAFFLITLWRGCKSSVMESRYIDLMGGGKITITQYLLLVYLSLLYVYVAASSITVI